MSRRRLVVFGVVGAVLLLGMTAAARGDEPAATPEKPAGIRVNIAQNLQYGGLTTTGNYRALFVSGGKFHLEGSVQVGAFTFDVIMVGDGAQLRELVTSPLGTQYITYNLAAVREMLPTFDPSRGYSPEVFADLLRELPEGVKPRAETLNGAAVDVYTLETKGQFQAPNLGLGPGAAPAAVEAQKLRVYMLQEPREVRRVELLAVKEGKEAVVMGTDYSDFEAAAEVGAEEFALEAPKDATLIDGTALLRAWFTRQQADQTVK